MASAHRTKARFPVGQTAMLLSKSGMVLGEEWTAFLD